MAHPGIVPLRARLLKGGGLVDDSIGEVLAAEMYDLTLLSSADESDAQTDDGRKVQIRTTQGAPVALRSEPDYLLVLGLSNDGVAIEVYNGPGGTDGAGGTEGVAQPSIAVDKLRALITGLPLDRRIPRVSVDSI